VRALASGTEYRNSKKSLIRRVQKFTRQVERWGTRFARKGATKKPDSETKALLLVHDTLGEILEEMRVTNDLRRAAVCPPYSRQVTVLLTQVVARRPVYQLFVRKLCSSRHMRIPELLTKSMSMLTTSVSLRDNRRSKAMRMGVARISDC
jgi:hypothetical protein